GKTRRRSVRGRRSLIRVAVEGSSPVVVAAPLSDSIMQNTAVDKVTQLTQRIEQVRAYMDHLRSQKEEWEQLLERQHMKNQHAASKVDRPYERKPSARVPIEDLGHTEAMQKPRHVLNRVLRAFNKRNEDIQSQRDVNKLQEECDSISSSIDTLKARTENLVALLYAEPKEKLLERKTWLEDLKSKEARRRRVLEEKLARLEAQEAHFSAARAVSCK
ncbi:hypothetical protein COOONC_00814, partial [Cooperia oncophora]